MITGSVVLWVVDMWTEHHVSPIAAPAPGFDLGSRPFLIAVLLALFEVFSGVALGGQRAVAGAVPCFFTDID